MAVASHDGTQRVPCVSNGPVGPSGPLVSPELLRSRPLQRAHPHDPGLSRPVPCWRSPDRWTCARSSSTARGPVLEHLRSAPCPGLYNKVYPPRRAIQCTFASLGCGLFRRLAPTLGRLPVQLFGFLRRAVAVSIGIESAVRSLAATQTGPGVRPVTTPTQFLHWPTRSTQFTPLR